MQDFKGVVHALKADKSRLRLGTALTSAALLACLPGSAHAAIRTSSWRLTPPTLTQITAIAAPPAENDHNPALAAIASSQRTEAAPQDLTVHPTQPILMSRRLAGGDVTINEGDISVSGDNNPGLVVNTGGAASVTVGTVSTTGAYSPGLSVSAGGPIAITSGDITTTGSYSPGVTASNAADITIHTGAVTATGVNSNGIYASSTGGNVTINTGDIRTGYGGNAAGIYANGHDVDITAGNIEAGSRGIEANGIGAGAAVNISVTGNIVSNSRTAHGIAANSDGTISINDSGNIISDSTAAIFPGFGIGASAYGDVQVNAQGTIKQYGIGKGILAQSIAGNVSVTASNIDIYGEVARGIAAYSDGKTTVMSGNILGTGKQSAGITATGASVDVTSTGTIEMDGYGSSGIIAIAYSGSAAVHNQGTITLGPLAEDGISAIAAGNVVIDGGGSITLGQGGTRYTGQNDGILAYSQRGDISISQGNIKSYWGGIVAIAPGGAASGYAPHAISIDIGNVATSGTGADATGIYAYNHTIYGSTNIKIGDVSTIGDAARGIYSTSALNDVTITGGSVETRGNHASGVRIIDGLNDTVDLSSISTSGYYSAGLEIATAPSSSVIPETSVKVNVGSISTLGAHSSAMTINNYGSIDVTVGSVSTTGDISGGVVATSSSSSISLTIGSLTTAGYGSIGIYGTGTTGTSISAQSVATQGDGALGVYAANSGTGTLTLDLGTVSTKGRSAAGVVGLNGGGPVAINAQSVTTSGDASDGVVAVSYNGAVNVNVATTSTSGLRSAGIAAYGATSTTVSAGTVTTTGYGANGIVIGSGAAGVDSSGVINVDTVSTAGDRSAAILATARGDTGHNSTLSITAGSITTTGQDAQGILAIDNYSPLSIKVGSISAKGSESYGILAFGGSDIGIQAGSIQTKATSVYTYSTGKGTIALSASGAISSSAGDGLFAINRGGATDVTVGAGGSIQAAGDAVRIESGTGLVSINNAGTIAGGSGYAINLTALPASLNPDGVSTTTPAGATIANSGTIEGAVSLGAGNDLLTNSGLFIATKDSSFGGGDNQFVNSGTFQVASSGANPAAIHLLGLESFQNSGLIDLRNGVVGDTLTLPGTYVGTGKAELGLDVGTNGADKLIVSGAATGTTSIVLGGSAANATLLAKPVTLVEVGAGSSAGAFHLANQNIGFVTYGLAFDAANNSYQLTASAGTPVRRLAKLDQAAQALWQQSADAWSGHMRELRDETASGSRVWGQSFGGIDNRHDDAGGENLGYRQDYYGGQAGYDIGGKQDEDGKGFVFGLTTGYLSSHVNFTGSADRVRFDTFNFGGYAGLRAGSLFVNLLGQYDHFRIHADNTVEHYSDGFGGNSVGVSIEGGAHFGTERFFVEPLATLSWQRTDLGALHALGQQLDFDHDTGVQGTLGGRIGGSTALKGGAKASFYLQASYVHQFKGDGSILFESGSTGQDVSGTKLGDYGHGAVGVNVLTSGRLSGFIEGDVDVGSASKGGGGRVGLSFKL